MQTFNVTSGPVVGDYVTSGREEELLRVLDAIGARDVLIGPEGNRVEITFVLDAESSNAAVTTADGTLTTFAGGFWPGAVVASRIDSQTDESEPKRPGFRATPTSFKCRLWLSQRSRTGTLDLSRSVERVQPAGWQRSRALVAAR